MTKQEAIEILRDTPIDIRSTREDDIHTLYATAQGMAIEALQRGLENVNADSCSEEPNRSEPKTSESGSLDSEMPEIKTDRTTSGDLINRQDAINAFDGVKVDEENCTEYDIGYNDGIDFAISNLSVLPSAQPEIIRCKDCKWWDKSEDSPFGYCMAMKHGYMSANWEIGIYRRYKGDFYCADAERRTDDKTNKGASR